MELSPEELAGFFDTVLPHLNERQTRVVAGAMAVALGHGGQARVVEASGMSSSTVYKSVAQVRSGVEPTDRQRAVGGGDKPAIDKQPGLLEALDELVHPSTRGTPMSALRWTLKSTYELAGDLQAQGFRASAELVRRFLHQMGYSLQAPAKANEGTSHPDRDAQFAYINKLVARRLKLGEPVISVDTKKKELIGNYANGGSEWQPAGEPTRTNVHDFADPALGEFAKAIPYGVYDVGNDEGWVSVGDTADTAEFAVESIRRWWNQMGRERFPDASTLLDHRGRRRVQRPEGQGLQVPPGKARRRNGAFHHGLSLSTRHVEVEQDRAPSLQLHLDQLEGPIIDEHSHHRRAHRRHQDQDRSHRPVRLRPQLVPHRRQDQRP